MLAGLILNIFHQHCDRIKIANIAQMVNVLQALFLTKDDKMILTPTYYVFDMYKVHQDATMLPLELNGPMYSRQGRQIKAVSASASKDVTGKIHISFVNIDPTKAIEISCNLDGAAKQQFVSGNVITAPKVDTFNSFENPNQVVLKDFKDAKLKSGVLEVKLPAKSLVTIELE